MSLTDKIIAQSVIIIAIKCEILVVGSCAKYVQAPLLRIQSKQLVYQVAGKGILSWIISVYTLENAEYGLHFENERKKITLT